MFDISGLTPIEAAGEANLWKAFMYLSSKQAENDYVERLHEQYRKQ